MSSLLHLTSSNFNTIESTPEKNPILEKISVLYGFRYIEIITTNNIN